MAENFNGKKVTSCERTYMNEEEIITSVLALKTKNCEGYVNFCDIPFCYRNP